jgi:hypothetical protein
MRNTFIFFSIWFCLIIQGCNSPTNSNQSNDMGKKEVSSIKMLCDDVLKNDSINNLQKIYFDTLVYANNALLFVTRDSALLVYSQHEKDCTLLFKLPIDSTDLYTYRDGSPLFLKDLDGDKQKEVLVTVQKNGGNSNFRVYKLDRENGQVSLKKIQNFEKIINPELDSLTGLVRSHWYEKGDYELDEYYQISKENQLIFIKGFERSNGKDKRYEAKEGW